MLIELHDRFTMFETIKFQEREKNECEYLKTLKRAGLLIRIRKELEKDLEFKTLLSSLHKKTRELKSGTWFVPLTFKRFPVKCRLQTRIRSGGRSSRDTPFNYWILHLKTFRSERILMSMQKPK